MSNSAINSKIKTIYYIKSIKLMNQYKTNWYANACVSEAINNKNGFDDTNNIIVFVLTQKIKIKIIIGGIFVSIYKM